MRQSSFIKFHVPEVELNIQIQWSALISRLIGVPSQFPYVNFILSSYNTAMVQEVFEFLITTVKRLVAEVVNTQIPCWDLASRAQFPARFYGRNFECYCESGLTSGGPKPSQSTRLGPVFTSILHTCLHILWIRSVINVSNSSFLAVSWGYSLFGLLCK